MDVSLLGIGKEPGHESNGVVQDGFILSAGGPSRLSRSDGGPEPSRACV